MVRRPLRAWPRRRASVRSGRSTPTTASGWTSPSAGDADIAGQHYAFLVSEDDFTAIYGRIVDRGMDHWADPHQHQPGTINTHDGGRGVYFLSPDGHFLEIITRPYGSG